MKTLYLLRHGQAESKQNQTDAERNLTETGKKQALLTGEKLLKEGLRPDIIISSHAFRAYQTAQIVAETLAYPVKNILIEQEIYFAGEEKLVDLIKTQDNQHASIMIVGHNPTITYAAQTLSKNQNIEMPTAGLLIMEFSAGAWTEIQNHEVKEILYFEPDVNIK